jgi:hypothetical protein
VGRSFEAVHPVVRTHPVTGWKSVYAVATFPKYINELNENESQEVLKILRQTLLDNHQLHVRFKWRNEHDFGKTDSPSPPFVRVRSGTWLMWVKTQPSGTTAARSTRPPTTTMVWETE